MRTHLKELLSEYALKYPDEKEKAVQTINLINNEKDCFERENWSGHFTGSAWIVDDTRSYVLMTHHYQLNMWLQLGGHAEGCLDLLAVALNEAIEESGIINFKTLTPKIFDLDIHNIPIYNGIPAHRHYDVRFIFEADSNPDLIKISEESHDVSWVHINNVSDKNPENSIKRMIEKTANF